MPLEYMLRAMRDPTVEYNRRDDMARAASAYCHPKLSTIDHGGKDGGALVVKIVDSSEGSSCTEVAASRTSGSN